MTKRIAFIGLGVMGYPMAGHLARAGHDVTVFNRTLARAQAWVAEYGGRHSHSPAEAAENAEIVLTCVGNDDDVRAVTTAPGGAFESLSAGTIYVDHTTASATLARELEAAAAERGAKALDAPVSGGQAGAENAALTIMVGGETEAFEEARGVLAVYARQLRRMGAAGAGQLTKMVNQICIAGILQGLAEGLHFAECAGLDIDAVVDVISKGAAQSWQMDNRAATMARGEFEFGFAVDWMRKDLAIALEEARSNGAPLPVAALVDQLYREVQALGGGRWDTSSLIARQRAVNPRPGS